MPEQAKYSVSPALKSEFRRHQSELENCVAEALCQAYRDITGKKPSDRFISNIESAIRMELL